MGGWLGGSRLVPNVVGRERRDSVCVTQCVCQLNILTSKCFHAATSQSQSWAPPLGSHVYVCAQSCLTLCDPMDCSHQTPLSMASPRREYWSGLPFPSPGDFPDPGIKPVSPAWQADIPKEKDQEILRPIQSSFPGIQTTRPRIIWLLFDYLALSQSLS